MYKRRAPSTLSFSSKVSKPDRNAKPSPIEAVVEQSDENDSGNANDSTQDPDSPFVIPASQQADVTTQRRFYSQRSNANLSRSQIVAQTSVQKRVPSSFFENTLLRCGVIFDNPQYFVIGCDHINFVNKLRTMLQSAPDFPENVDRFVSGLREYMKDEMQMTKVLSVCMINVPNCDFMPQSQDCLMRNFLMIDFLEEKAVELLLDMFTDICSESNPTDQNICSAILILTQLGFVNKRIHADLIFQHAVTLLGLTEDIFRNEIIKFLPEILDVKKHDTMVEKIISMMGSDPSKYLNEITVNSFEAMQLSPHLRSQLKTRIIRYIQEEDASVKLYPAFTKFLLNCHSTENYVELISQFRRIDWTAANSEDSSLVNEMQKEVFQFILRSLKRSKELHDGWLRSILNSSRVEDCFPMDIVVLIIMSTINEDRSMYLENVLRRKIKLGWITREIFKQGIVGFPVVISQHLKVFFEFIDNLFRSKDDLFEFGEIGYKLAFKIPNCDQKLLLSKLIAFVCEKNDDHVVRRALVLLQEICQDHPNEVQNYSLQILRVLDKVNDVGLYEYRLIMDLLSSIAYPPPPSLPIEGIAAHIDILVRKQVTGSGNNLRRQGIVGSVRVIDHLVWHADEKSAMEDRDTDVTIESVEDLPNGNAKTAGNAITMMLLSADNCPHNKALCYDELAAAFSPRMMNLRTSKFVNRPFMGWFADMVTCEFQEIFIVDEVPEIEGALTLDKMFLLNRTEEFTETNTGATGIALNIGGLVFGEGYKTRPIISCLSPIFNLCRILHFHRYDGDLVGINAVLGCPIIFPMFINGPDELEFDDVPRNMLLLDVFFYTVNWFREIICAFASQRELNIRRKVLIRLTHLIGLEAIIRMRLRDVPQSYVPPTCHFMTMDKNDMDAVQKMNSQASGSGASKGKDKEATKKKKKGGKTASAITADSIPNNSTLMAGDRTQNCTMANLTASKVEEKRSVSSSGFYGPKEIYRQLDLDIMMLLQESLCTSYPLPKERIGTCLGLAEYKFILQDLILKFESVTGLKKSTGFQQEQFIISSFALIYDTKSFIERFMHFFDQLSTTIQRNQELGESEATVSEIDMYTDEMGQLKNCFGLTLRLLAALFSWQGFHQEKHQPLLKEYLLTVLNVEESSTDCSIKILCDRVIDAMILRLPSVLDLYSAVHLYHLVDALSNYTNDHAKSMNLCRKFLKRQWHSNTGATERGNEANTLLNVLLKGQFKTVDAQKIRRCIEKITQDMNNLKKRDAKLKDFPNFNRSNFPILFRSIINALFEFTVQKLDKDMTTLMKLELWENVYSELNSLLDIVKAANMPRNFSLFLRYSQMILKLFLQHGMPMVETNLKSHGERVVALLKSLQVTTRFLHQLCCHSKSVKNSGIISLIPGLRQSVESLNYGVKAALVANNFSSTFWLGNLKNLDMQGEDIVSQVVSLSDGQEGGSGDEQDDFAADDSGNGGEYLGITTICNPSQAAARRRTTKAVPSGGRRTIKAGPSGSRRTTRNRK